MASHGPRATTASSRGTQMRRSLEEILSGIDDPKLVRSIKRRYVFQSRSADLALIIAVVVALGLHAVLRRLTGDNLGLSILLAAVVGAIAGGLIRRRARNTLPDVLRSMGRCESCGYLLAGSTTERCPECGEPISTESSADKR